jgi:hypothetical protein
MGVYTPSLFNMIINYQPRTVILCPGFISIKALKKSISCLEPPCFVIILSKEKGARAISNALNSIKGFESKVIERNVTAIIKDKEGNPSIFISYKSINKLIPSNYEWWNSSYLPNDKYKYIFCLDDIDGFFPSRKEWKVLQIYNPAYISIFDIDKNLLHQIPINPNLFFL